MNWVDYGSDVDVLANTEALLLFETQIAKEAKSWLDCWGNLLDCSIGGILGIVVWTKW
ncbi:MAG: hypothetical protein N2645_11575 [Clostridia bacterium]|nr:hypothetical protein [Clostridia bacterium]